MHDVLATNIALVVILAGILLNRLDARHLEAKLEAQSNNLEGKIEAQSTKLEAKISELRTEMARRFDAVDPGVQLLPRQRWAA